MAELTVPQINFSGLGDLPQVYRQVRADAAIDDASTAIRNGDNAALMDALLRARQIGPAIELAKLGRQQEASREFSNSLSGIFGGGQQAAAPQPLSLAALRPAQNQPSATAPDAPIGRPMAGPSSNLTDPASTIERVDYGPVTNSTGQMIAPAPPPIVRDQSQPANNTYAQAQQRPIGPSPSLAGVSLDKAVPALLQAASNPNLPKEQQETARLLLGKAFDQYPQEIRQLEIFKQRPDLFQMAKELKNAGATVINTAEGMDAAQAKARIEIDKHAVTDLSKKVASGRSALPLLTQMMAINDKTPGGWSGAAAPYLAKAAQTLGIPVPDGASNAELFNSMSRQFIPSVRDPGSTSNYEQSLYSQAVPSLSQSQDGRAKIASMMKAQILRNAEILATYRKYVGRPELDAKLAEIDAKPMFSPEDRKALEVAVSQPQAPAVPAGMPPGARQAPDGNFYVPDPQRPGKFLQVR